MTTIVELPDHADTLRYRIQVQRALPQDDIRITVPVTALVHTRDNDPAALQQSIRAALNVFVPAEWMFSRIERGGDAVGYERIQLSATTRVKSGENYDLAERARRSSREGLTLGLPRVDYALSPDKIDEVVGALRTDILRRVGTHIDHFGKETGRTWRIGDIAFGFDDVAEYGTARTGKGAYRDIDNLPSSPDEQGPTGGLAGAERIKLVASVTLRATPDVSSAQD